MTSEPPLSGFTTLRTGGPAERMVIAETDAALIDAIAAADAAGEPLTIFPEPQAMATAIWPRR